MLEEKFTTGGKADDGAEHTSTQAEVSAEMRQHIKELVDSLVLANRSQGGGEFLEWFYSRVICKTQ